MHKTRYCDACMKLFDYHGPYQQGAVLNRYRLTLLENSLDFLNSSLASAIRFHEESDSKSLKFAIIHVVFAIELLLKEVLRRKNSSLIYQNAEGAGSSRTIKTVSWTEAIARMRSSFPDQFDSVDSGRLATAQRLRNQIIHYDVEYDLRRALRDYTSLVDLVQDLYHHFIENELMKPLDKFIYPENWEREQALSTFFRTECTTFNGFVVYKSFMEDQKYSHIILMGEKFERIPFGAEHSFLGQKDFLRGYYEYACHDCDAVEGLYHGLGCDVEVCPRCRGQLLSCGCADLLSEPDYGASSLRSR
jgi:hypothetical protein